MGPSTRPARSSTTVTFERFAFPVFVTVPEKAIGWPGAGASWQDFVTSIAQAKSVTVALPVATTGSPQGWFEAVRPRPVAVATLVAAKGVGPATKSEAVRVNV